MLPAKFRSDRQAICPTLVYIRWIRVLFRGRGRTLIFGQILKQIRKHFWIFLAWLLTRADGGGGEGDGSLGGGGRK